MNFRRSRRGLDTAYAGTDVCQAQSVVSATSTLRDEKRRKEPIQPSGPHRVDPDIADDQKVGLNFVNQLHECIDGGTDDRPLFNILHAGRLRPVSGVAKHPIH
jgi:hypothetical protein